MQLDNLKKCCDIRQYNLDVPKQFDLRSANLPTSLVGRDYSEAKLACECGEANATMDSVSGWEGETLEIYFAFFTYMALGSEMCYDK